MTRKRKFILAGVAAAAVGLTAAGAIADRGHHWRGHHKGHHFGHMGGSMGFLDRSFSGHSMFCKGNSAEFADIMLVRLEHRLKVTDDQKEAFDTFKDATRTAIAKLSEDCPEGRGPRGASDEESGERKHPTPVERLAKRQERLESSLEALKAYRPAAEAFYAKLTDDQKKTLNERRGKRHAWRGGGRHHDRWERRGPRHERGEHRRNRDRDSESEPEADNAPAADDRD